MADKKIEISPIDADFDSVANAMLIEDNPPPKRYALLSGPLPIGNVHLQCAVLDDETRILSATSIFIAFKKRRKGMNDRLQIDGTTVPPFIAANNLKPYINQEVMGRTRLIEYRDGTSVKTGYDAALLADLCEVYLSARRDGVLMAAQLPQAEQAEVLLTAFAKVGIAAVIDEATGYQKVRTNDALRLLLSRYIAEGLQKWVKTFPDSFFVQLDKLYDNETTTSRNRPKYYGRFINKYIYKPLENGYVKAKLDELNINDDGTRKARFHQWLSNDGRDALIRQLARVEARMEMHSDIKAFKKAEEKQKTISIAPYLYDDMNKIIK